MSSHDSSSPLDSSDSLIWVNGEAHALPTLGTSEGSGEARGGPEQATTVAALLGTLGLANRRIAVALNRSVVPRSRYAATALGAGDRVEILEAVGGG